jgi:hypothetical protein
MKRAVFWDLAPCRYYVNRRFIGTYRLHLQGRRQEQIRERSSFSRCNSPLVSTLKMEAIRSSETSVNTKPNGAHPRKLLPSCLDLFLSRFANDPHLTVPICGLRILTEKTKHSTRGIFSSFGYILFSNFVTGSRFDSVYFVLEVCLSVLSIHYSLVKEGE